MANPFSYAYINTSGSNEYSEIQKFIKNNSLQGTISIIMLAQQSVAMFVS